MKKLILLNTKTLFSVMLLCLLSCVSTGCGSSSLDGAKEVPEVNGTVCFQRDAVEGRENTVTSIRWSAERKKTVRQILTQTARFIRSNDKEQKIIASDYKVFISLNTDPSIEGLKGLCQKNIKMSVKMISKLIFL